MKRALLGALVLLAGCGGPAAPTAPPTPPPPVYPNMLGGWGGTWSQVWITGLGTGSQTCNQTWIVTGQTDGVFSGTYQISGESCASAGSISGSVLPDGSLQIQPRANGSSQCSLIAGGGAYYGFVSVAGGVTAQAKYALRCPYGNGTLDYQVTATVAVNRR